MVELLALAALCGLVTWRLTSLLHTEDAFEWLRKRIEIEHDREGYPFAYPDTFWARQFECFWCLANWVSVPVTLVATIAAGTPIWQGCILNVASITIAIWLERQLMRSKARGK